jgi:hypothetical protein
MVPCPSPNGTNFERLFIVRKPERMAMDAALGAPNPSSPVSSPFDGGDPGGDDLADKIHQLLDGKLDDADIETLIEMIQQGATPQVAGDRRRGLATDALLRSRVSTGLARQTQTTTAGLMKRFPTLKTARVIG